MSKEKERLLERQKQIAERLKTIKAKESQSERAKDTRQKVLFAAYCKAKRADLWEQIISSDDFKHYLTRNVDRKAFDLPLLPEKKRELKQTQGGNEHKGEEHN